MRLQSYRHGLSKLVNSLSWGPRIVVPKADRPGRHHLPHRSARLSVERSNLGRDPRGQPLWREPDAPTPRRSAPRRRARRCPHVRGDWFVAAAARPPLYHDVLKLPKTDRGSGKTPPRRRRRNIRQERVARAGFNGSGVSRNNRLIERHEVGRGRLLEELRLHRQHRPAEPVRPSARAGRWPSANSSTTAARSSSTCPTACKPTCWSTARAGASTKGRPPSSAIRNAPIAPSRTACRACRATPKGMIEKNDQIRDHVLKNPKAFADADVETVKALYPPHDEFNALIRKDAKRFQEAVARTGAPAERHRTDRGPGAALRGRNGSCPGRAEAGVSPSELLRPGRSAVLAKRLGPLKVEAAPFSGRCSSTLSPTWCRNCKLGEFLPSRQAGSTAHDSRGRRPAQKGNSSEPSKAYGEALAVDPHSALAYNNRGLALNEEGISNWPSPISARPCGSIRVSPSPSTIAAPPIRRKANSTGRSPISPSLSGSTPTSAVGFNNRGYALLRKRKPRSRRWPISMRRLRLQPKFAFALNNRGLAHAARATRTKAIADFSAAIALDPEFAKA